MPIELHVPDLPPLTLGPDASPKPPKVRQPWHWRLRELVGAYMPLLLMVLLALSTWWLVQNTPVSSEPRPARPLLHEPDYTMQRFKINRFGADGRLQTQVEGEQLRHYPDTDTLEIDQVRIRMRSPDGATTVATARRAVSNGDGSEMQLMGGAQVVSTPPPGGGERIEFRGEFLHAFLDSERLRSHLPVTVLTGGNELKAGGMEYDHLTRTMQLTGRVRGVFLPPSE